MVGLAKLYVVERQIPEGMPEVRPSIEGRYPRAFLDRSAAETFRTQMDRRARRAGDLELLLGANLRENWLFEQTEFEPGVFLDWLADADVPPPPSPAPNEDEWEVRVNWLTSLSLEQRVHLCAGLHRLSWYQIVEVDLIEGDYPSSLWEGWEIAPSLFCWEEQPPTAPWPAPPEPAEPAPGDEDIPF